MAISFDRSFKSGSAEPASSLVADLVPDHASHGGPAYRAERASARENGTPDRTDSRADRRIPIPRRHAGAGTQTERHHHDDRTDCKSLDRFHRITSLEYRV
jgi:hypothetical protein